MQEILQNQPEPEQRKPLPLNVLLGALVIVAIALTFWLAFKSPQGSSSRVAQSNVSVPMSQAEQAYAKSIQIENIALSRAENFIHQEVTILNADAVNAGQQSVAGLAVTVEFFDDLHQVVLRESRSVLGSPSAALGPGQRRSFSISFDRVPSSWNLQQPSARVTYLQLATLK
ncbi:MAG TPA: hypothetical protein VGP66_11510 [Candidatus Acidoferrum sp.]|jgi:hypothetical protein|nr:hypothetical protein [Candidatus Acidoferrum sp.]